MIKKLNRRGFTLVELLAVIAIITLVLGLTSYGVIEILNNSKNDIKNVENNNDVTLSTSYEKNTFFHYWIRLPWTSFCGSGKDISGTFYIGLYVLPDRRKSRANSQYVSDSGNNR